MFNPVTSLKLAVTGFVSANAGSVAGANSILLRKLLDRGHRIDFFSKPSFVDPRPFIHPDDPFRFVSVVNTAADLMRRITSKVPILNLCTSQLDTHTYNRLLITRIAKEHIKTRYEAVMWLGDYAAGKIPGVPSVSFTQGPPGTDARSIIDRGEEIRKYGGRLQYAKLITLARLRLSRMGLPQFDHSDHLLVGSKQACQMLIDRYHVSPKQCSVVPYPIDLELFSCDVENSIRRNDSLKVLWIGRVIPRKRLDLFLDGCKKAIDDGIPLEMTIIGGIGFAKGYEQMINSFPYPKLLHWIKSVPHEKLPSIIRQHDLLIQPSDEENFGSSVAEALACGIPVIVGATNGTADYIDSNSIRLADDRVETFASALRKMQASDVLKSRNQCREAAVKWFEPDRVVDSLENVLRDTALNFGKKNAPR